MISYFDALMPIYLLYEGELYETTQMQPHNYCTIVHLLRFLIKLPEFLSPLLADEETETTIMPFVKRFTEWLSRKTIELKVLDYWEEFYEAPCETV